MIYKWTTSVIIFTCFSIVSLAATRTWDGGGGDNNWSTAANWVGDMAPAPGDDLIFTGTVSDTTNNDYPSGTSFNSIRLTGAVGSGANFTLSGNSIVLSGGTSAIHNSAGTAGVGGYTLTINNNITFSSANPTIRLSVASQNNINITGSIDNAGYTITVDNVGSNSNVTLSGGITGSGGLIKNNSAYLILGGTSSYTGPTTMNNGGIRFTSNQPLGPTGNVFNINGGIIDALTANRTFSNSYVTNINNNVTFLGSRNLTMGPGTYILNTSPVIHVGNNTLTFNGVVSGNNSLTKSGVGTLVFSAVNTYTGSTTITDGTLRLGASASIPNTSAMVVTSPGIFNTNSFSDTVGSIAGSGRINNASGGGTPILTTGIDNSSTTFSGTIDNTSGTLALTKVGTGTLTLSGVNTYNGKTTVSNGAIRLGASGVISDNSALEVSNGALFNVNTYTETVGSIGGAGTIDNVSGGGNPILTTGGDNSSTIFSGVIKNTTGTLGLVKIGTGTLTLSGTNTYSGSTTISTGTLALGAVNTVGPSNMILNGGQLSTNGFANDITGTVSLTENSSLALGGGSVNALKYLPSSGASWTSGKMLTITNWTGPITATGSSGTTGQLFVGANASGLLPSQLAQIQFLIGGVNYPALQLATGEIVPISPTSLNLVSFKGKISGDVVELHWNTVSESNIKKYIVEKSCDGNTWFKLSEISPNNMVGLNNYNITDYQPCTESNHYRLIEVENSLKHIEHSKIFVDFGREESLINKFVINQNLESKNLTILVKGIETTYELNIINTKGQIVTHEIIETGENLLKCNEWLPGCYILMIRDFSNIKYFKILII